jgi:LacI family transcriptional regulator
VLNNRPNVTPDNRAKVLAALEATGFVLNAQAKAMRTSKSGSIGIVTSEIQNPFLPYLLDELTRAATAMSVNVVVWNDESADARLAVDGMAAGAVDGLIFTAARQGSTGLQGLIDRGAPVVLCNRASLDSEADIVMTDHRACGRLSGEYLVRNGRRRIAAIFGSPDTYASPLREAGFVEALTSAGVDIDPRLVRRGRTGYETGSEAIKELLESGAEIDAVFCSSDIIAYGAMDALKEHGVSVPEDVWVMGIDGLPMSRWRAFDLTTYEQDVTDLAKLTIERLVSRLGGDHAEPTHQLIPPSLAIRSSTNSMG